MKTTEKLVPELRFPEFTGEWEEKSLGEIAEVVMGQSPKSKSYNNIGKGYPLVQGNADIKDRETFPSIYTTAPTKICEKDELILTVRAPVGSVARSKHRACIGRGVCSIKSNDNFLFYYLIKNENKWYRLAQGSTFTAINSKDINSFKIIKPNNLEEQEKIGNFFYKVDKKLDLQRKKIEDLKNYKKAMMQRMFDQEIRFKDEDGNEYPEWEEKRLGDIGSFLTSSVNKKIESNESLVRLYNYMDVYNKYIIKNENIEKLNITSATSLQIKNNNLLKGDILITPSSETPEDIGHSVVIPENLYDTVYSYHLLRFRPSIKLDIKFSNYWLNNINVRKEFIKISQGATRFTISIKNIEHIKVKYPCLREQIKIGNFFYKIDKKIELEEEKLEEFEQYKKGLMQRMFI